MSLLTDLKHDEQFNASEKAVARYIITNKEDVLNLSIQALSELTYTSPSTVVRLCRKIGLRGFKDFKIKWSAELQKEYNAISNVDPDFPFTDDDSYGEIQKKILELFTDSLNQTSQLLSPDKLEQAVELLLQADKIGVFAYGDTYLPALNFQNKLMKINRSVHMAALPGENRHLATNFKQGDCAIVISYSGESKNNYYITQLLKQNGATIIVITGSPSSHIASLGDLILPVAESESQSVKLSTFSSQTAIDYVLNTLYGCLFVSNYDKNQSKRISSETLFLDERF
ncbi:MurR/RpiR family transcriptional regulator [Alkalibacterium sp. s-m-22]|uniref:MurR/RpiR family transcriptional regulator n=1 Tax=Alkalibacterium indicireducens TaxID=398758 RepID=A0ABP3K7I1_9LACT